MKFGFSLFPLLAYPQAMVDAARKAEEAGFESAFSPDHLIFPIQLPNTYPYAKDGRSPVQGTDGPRYDAWALLSHLAGVTKKLKLGTNVYILPLRDPIATARAVMTLDVLSNGRAVLGCGVGWLQEEFEIIGRDFKSRGAVMDETILLLKQLWTQRVVEFKGKHLSYGPVMFEPKPVQKPHPPILIGGTTPAALKRAARLGDGWMSTGDDFETTKAKLGQLRKMLKENGREKAPFSVTVSAQAADLDTVRRFEEIGVERLLVSPVNMRDRVTPQVFLDGLSRLADKIVAKA